MKTHPKNHRDSVITETRRKINAPPPPRREATLYGAKEDDEELQAAVKMAWLFVGRLRENTNIDTIKNYIRKNGITDGVECEEIQTRGRSKAFRLGLHFNRLSEVEAPEFWPKGVRVERFRFRSRPFQDTYLNA